LERSLRVAGGKTLALDVECQGDEVVRVMISGDFFFYPEEGLAGLEAFLVANRVWKAEDPEWEISKYMSKNGYRAVGFAPSDLAFLLRGLKC
jgi:hypothetical protein